MNRHLIAVPAAGLAVSAVTVANRLGAVPLRELATTPASLADGRVWLLLTSAVVADRPAIASVAGFLIVGLAAGALVGGRVLWGAAAAGHLLGTLAVYALLDAASVTVTRPDYGTSAIIFAWIGAIAYALWSRGHTRPAVALPVVSVLVGLLFRPQLDVLDTEHAAALALGIAAAAWLPRVAVPPLAVVRLRLALGRRLLHDRLALRAWRARRVG